MTIANYGLINFPMIFSFSPEKRATIRGLHETDFYSLNPDCVNWVFWCIPTLNWITTINLSTSKSPKNPGKQKTDGGRSGFFAWWFLRQFNDQSDDAKGLRFFQHLRLRLRKRAYAGNWHSK